MSLYSVCCSRADTELSGGSEAILRAKAVCPAALPGPEPDQEQLRLSGNMG
jgi:hypothetical protein